VSQVLNAYIIALMIERVRTSETSVNFYETTGRSVSIENSHLHSYADEKFLHCTVNLALLLYEIIEYEIGKACSTHERAEEGIHKPVFGKDHLT
jgi:hypothetical protein